MFVIASYWSNLYQISYPKGQGEDIENEYKHFSNHFFKNLLFLFLFHSYSYYLFFLS